MAVQVREAPKRLTMAQEVENLVTGLLVEGRFAPGDRLKDGQLCKELGATHTPLREALRALASKGLLEHAVNRGYRVRVISDAEMLQLYEVRMVLEGRAAWLLAPRVTEEQIAELHELARAIPTDVRRTPQSQVADWTFHARIAEWSGNTFVSELLSSVHVLARVMLGAQVNIPVPPRPATDHSPIVRAIASRDQDQAEAAMRAHLADAVERTRLRLGWSDTGAGEEP